MEFIERVISLLLRKRRGSSSALSPPVLGAVSHPGPPAPGE